MRLAKRGEDFSRNIIINDSIALVKVRGTEISKVTIIGGFPGSMILNQKNEAPRNVFSKRRDVFAEEDLEYLQGALVAIYETKKGKKETLLKKARQLAELLENGIFSQIVTIELIGYGEMGLIFLLAAGYVERSLHIATVNIAEEIPYIRNLYVDDESLDKLALTERARYRNRFLRNINFETIAKTHKWMNFQDKWLKPYTTVADYDWLIKVNEKMVTEKSLRALDIPKTIELDLNYSTILKEVYRHFER